MGLLLVGLSSASLSKDISIAVLAFSGEDYARTTWQPTIDYLNRHIPQHEFSVIPVEPNNIKHLEQLVKQEKVDFVITQPITFVELQVKYGATSILTLVDESKYSEFGSVIFTRSNSNINNLSEVSGHSIAGATPKGLGGWLIGYNELVENSVNVFGQSKVSYLGVQENIINAVLNDTVDVGIVRTGVIERLVSENKLTLSDLKIINPKKVNGFPYILSTSLYPEWAFVKTSHASKSIAKDIATTLLLMPPGSTAALARGYSEWVTPVDYQPIHSLMKKLRIGVYKNYGKVGFLQYVKDNLILSTLVVILLMVLMVTGLWISRLNHARLQQKYEQDIEHITRLNTMGEVVTGIAHELNQPLTAIATSAFASSRLIESGKYSTNKLLDIFDLISLQAEHAASVIRHMRKLSDKNQIEYSLVNINTRIEDVIALMQANIKDAHIELVLNLSDNIPAILVQPIQIDQVLLNLCKNAIDAMVENTHKRVLTISTKLVGSELEVSLEDTGSGIDQAMQDRLFESFATQKKDGMGMGLSISRSIIERHYGNLYLEETSEHGSIFKFTLPIKK